MAHKGFNVNFPQHTPTSKLTHTHTHTHASQQNKQVLPKRAAVRWTGTDWIARTTVQTGPDHTEPDRRELSCSRIQLTF